MSVPFFAGGIMSKKKKPDNDMKEFMEDFRNQLEIETILDDFTHQINDRSYAPKDYNELKRETARKLIARFNKTG